MRHVSTVTSSESAPAHQTRLRDPAAALAVWDGDKLNHQLLSARVSGDWWGVLDRLRVTLLVTREYEHLVMALSVERGRPVVSYLPLPHPSGLAVNRTKRTVVIASTRNPNQVFELAPLSGCLERRDVAPVRAAGRPLMPVGSTIYPGAMYLHDLAFVGGQLYGNSVGQNAIARLPRDGGHELVWWPRAIERRGRPDTTRNYLQLNSIAAGPDLERSFFTASAAKMSSRRPGHLNFPVDRRGVVFSGATREPVLQGLTRPHSARIHAGHVWVADSGYGRLGVGVDGQVMTVAELPGWTRGVCLHDGIAFVGTSRVIPRFRHYAPGIRLERSRCAVHAVDLGSGQVLGSLTWPHGNQIFAIDWMPRAWSSGLPFRRGAPARSTRLFYTFRAP